MIRDPSDGSVKPKVPGLDYEALEKNRLAIEENRKARALMGGEKPSRDNNWGLKSLGQPPRIPTPAPTVDELREHYSKFGLRFKKKGESK